MRLRRAGEADAARMAAIHAAAFDPGWSAVELAASARGRGAFALAVDERAMLGFIIARVIAGEAEILTIAVDPSARRRGIGRALVAAAAGFAAQNGAAAMFLEVDVANSSAIALYEGEGFEQVGVRKGYYTNGADALVLRRSLNSRDAAAYIAS
jgi:ribosomal-protein-alanine N-acetyltransferase